MSSAILPIPAGADKEYPMSTAMAVSKSCCCIFFFRYSTEFALKRITKRVLCSWSCRIRKSSFRNELWYVFTPFICEHIQYIRQRACKPLHSMCIIPHGKPNNPSSHTQAEKMHHIENAIFVEEVCICNLEKLQKEKRFK